MELNLRAKYYILLRRNNIDAINFNNNNDDSCGINNKINAESCAYLKIHC